MIPIICSGAILLSTFSVQAGDKLKIRFCYDGSANDARSIALVEKFAPGIAEFAHFEPHWNGSLFRQGTELVAMARGNLDMTLTSAWELSEFFPEFTVFTAGYVLRDAQHQQRVFNAPLMQYFHDKVEEKLNIKLLAIVYLGKRQLNLRTPHQISTPEDLSGITLRMPGTQSWQFLGAALGASPTPMAFSEVYTALQTGAVDGQDNPLPIMVNSRLYEVTQQVILTSHIVDLNFISISKTTWDKLTTEQQQQLQNAAIATAEFAKTNQQKKEAELITFLKEQGLSVYTPNLDAFRQHVQNAYLQSEYAKQWPTGILDKINQL